MPTVTVVLYEVKRSQCHLLFAMENNRPETTIEKTRVFWAFCSFSLNCSLPKNYFVIRGLKRASAASVFLTRDSLGWLTTPSWHIIKTPPLFAHWPVLGKYGAFFTDHVS